VLVASGLWRNQNDRFQQKAMGIPAILESSLLLKSFG
jgi:hypothetical protein